MVGRRDLLVGLALSGLSLGRAGAASPPAPAGPVKLLAELEARSGGRLGVAVQDLQTGRRYGWRGQERFPMCSTFKLLAVAAVLARADKGREDLGRRIVYDRTVLLAHSPVTELHVGPPGMTLAALCEAAITQSDNAAANLILQTLGGPAKLTAWLRGLGDPATRLDRWEPELNTSLPGDPRDTTTPEAMLRSLGKLTLGDGLSAASQARLNAWLVANQTGDQRLRAGLPAGWRVGDKTGSGQRGTTNDVAVVWPPGRKPLLIAAYLTGGPPSGDARNAVLAEVGRIVAAAL